MRVFVGNSWHAGVVASVNEAYGEPRFIEVHFDDGDQRRDVDPDGDWLVERLTEDEELSSQHGDVCVVSAAWERVPLRCQYSHAPLNDPARGDRCEHRSVFNYESLKAFASKPCPLCSKPLARCASVVRDDQLRRGIQQLLTAHGPLDAVYARGHGPSFELRASPPGHSETAAAGGGGVGAEGAAASALVIDLVDDSPEAKTQPAAPSEPPPQLHRREGGNLAILGRTGNHSHTHSSGPRPATSHKRSRRSATSAPTTIDLTVDEE